MSDVLIRGIQKKKIKIIIRVGLVLSILLFVLSGILLVTSCVLDYNHRYNVARKDVAVWREVDGVEKIYYTYYFQADDFTYVNYEDMFYDTYEEFLKDYPSYKPKYLEFNDLALASVVLLCVFGVISYLIYMLHKANKKCYFIVTEESVSIKSLFVKPLNISTTDIVKSTTNFKRSQVVFSTLYKVIKVSNIENFIGVGQILSEIINKKQQSEIKNEEDKAVFSIDELKKFKELLDSGIITQEEFDAKKKQLLGL